MPVSGNFNSGGGGGGGTSPPPDYTFPAMVAGTGFGLRLVCHCPVETTFSGALIFFNDENVTANNAAYIVFELYEVDGDTGLPGAFVAQATTQLTGELALPNVDNEVVALVHHAMPLTDGPFTIAAGNSLMLGCTHTGGGQNVVGGGSVIAVPST